MPFSICRWEISIKKKFPVHVSGFLGTALYRLTSLKGRGFPGFSNILQAGSQRSVSSTVTFVVGMKTCPLIGWLGNGRVLLSFARTPAGANDLGVVMETVQNGNV